jgi:hypothetical protein
MSPLPSFTGAPSWSSVDDIRRQMNSICDDLNFFFTNLDSLNVKHLTADVIDAGTLNANLVTIRSDLTAGAYIQIDGTGFTINDGTRDTFHADINGQVTMTGAVVQSALGYPRVVMDPTGNLIGAYQDSDDFISLVPLFSGTPSVNFTASGTLRGQIHVETSSNDLRIVGTSGILLQTSSGDIELRPATIGGLVTIPSWSLLYSSGTSTDLQTYLNGKAGVGANTSSAGGHTHGIPNGTVLMVDGGGTVTFSSEPDHSHTQMFI